jgi:hypothetical protein
MDLKSRYIHIKDFPQIVQGMWFAFKPGESSCPYQAEPGWGQCRLKNWTNQLTVGLIYCYKFINQFPYLKVLPFYFPEDAARIKGPNIKNYISN